jgi:hypothetical protein
LDFQLFHLQKQVSKKLSLVEKNSCLNNSSTLARKALHLVLFLKLKKLEIEITKVTFIVPFLKVVYWGPFLTLLDAGVGLARPPSALSAAILWGMHQPIPNFLTFPNLIPTFIW